MGIFDFFKKKITTENIENNLKNISLKYLKDDDIINLMESNLTLDYRNIKLENNIFYAYYCTENREEERIKFASEKIYLYVDKYFKFKQLMLNLKLYFQIEEDEIIIFDEELCIFYCNLYQAIKKRGIEKPFDIIKFFQRYNWVLEASILGDTSIKIRVKDMEPLIYEYNIISRNKKEIIGKNNEEYIKIKLLNNEIWLGKEYLI